MTFGRGYLSVCPLRVFIGAHECCVSHWRGVPPGVPTGTDTKGTSPSGHFCASLNGRPSAATADRQRDKGTEGQVDKGHIMYYDIICQFMLYYLLDYIVFYNYS